MVKYRLLDDRRVVKPFAVIMITSLSLHLITIACVLYVWLYAVDISSEVDDLKGDYNCAEASQSSGRPKPGPMLIFDDEFDTFNLTVWKHEITLGGGGNWEFEYYDNNRSNSYVEDGVLYLKPTFLADDIGESNVQNGYTMDLWGSEPAALCTGAQFYGCLRTSGGGGNYLNPIRSARIRTAESFNFKYGRVEVKAKLPKGDWIWPAIWLLPTVNQYGNWPASGEIDIMESRGNDASYAFEGVDTFGSTLHWGPFFSENQYLKTHATKKAANGDFAQDFHIFGLIWNETYIGTYLDDPTNTVLSVPINESFWQLGGWTNGSFNNPWVNGGMDAPFDQEYFLILNVAVGGTNGYFPEGGGKPWSDKDPHAVNSFWNARSRWQSTWNGEDTAMKIDSIKVWSV